jgi:mannose-6-phosphate isomerase-like protein (cupin superfamily)
MSQKLEERTKAEVPAENRGHYEVLVDNDTTRITFHHIEKGQCSGWHLHDTNYVGYHFGDSEVRIERGEGDAPTTMASNKGVATFYDVGDGFEHNVTVVSDTPLIALEIEYKKG